MGTLGWHENFKARRHTRYKGVESENVDAKAFQLTVAASTPISAETRIPTVPTSMSSDSSIESDAAGEMIVTFIFYKCSLNC